MTKQRDNLTEITTGIALGLYHDKLDAEAAGERDVKLTKKTESSGPAELFTSSSKLERWTAKVPGGYVCIRQLHPDDEYYCWDAPVYEGFVSTSRGFKLIVRWHTKPSVIRKQIEHWLDGEKRSINSRTIRYSIPDLVWEEK